jgi:hypothetical protein
LLQRGLQRCIPDGSPHATRDLRRIEAAISASQRSRNLNGGIPRLQLDRSLSDPESKRRLRSDGSRQPVPTNVGFELNWKATTTVSALAVSSRLIMTAVDP